MIKFNVADVEVATHKLQEVSTEKALSYCIYQNQKVEKTASKE